MATYAGGGASCVYDATTLDDIAASAGISRWTSFHYFKSEATSAL